MSLDFTPTDISLSSESDTSLRGQTRWTNWKSNLATKEHLCLWSLVKHFGTHLLETLHMFRILEITNPTRSRETFSSCIILLAEIHRSSIISSWTASQIAGSVKVWVCPMRVSSWMLNWPVLKPNIQLSIVLCKGHFSRSLYLFIVNYLRGVFLDTKPLKRPVTQTKWNCLPSLPSQLPRKR